MWLAITYIRRRDSAATMSVTYRLVARALSAVDMQDFAGDERGGFEVEHPRDDVTDRAKPSQRMQTGQGGVIGVGVHRGVDDSR
jgi:hypothetical protein